MLSLILAVSFLLLPPLVSLLLFVDNHGASPLFEYFLPLFGASIIGSLIIAYKFSKARHDFVASPKVRILMGMGFTVFSFISACNFTHLFWAFKPVSWVGRLPYLYLHFCCFLQFSLLSSCKLRPRLYLYLISYPCSIFFSSTLFSLPFVAFLGLLSPPFPQVILFLPFLLACTGLYQTLYTRKASEYEKVDICVRNTKIVNNTSANVGKVRRAKESVPAGDEEEDFRPPLRIVQITDPHMGPIMSVRRLKTICQNAVKLNPDIIVLTGDFFTAEAYCNPGNVLAEALTPLVSFSGKTFACLGNHDKEGSAQKTVEEGLRAVGVRLLVDDVVVVNIPEIGDVQILGLDYRIGKGVADHVKSVCQLHPPIPSTPRLILLHDPNAFKHVPYSDNALVLSGHTHGGSVGLLSLGIRASIVGLFGVPDNGLWAHMTNYLYVHRGQGCRSLMGAMLVRLGIPTEDSVLQVYYEL